MQNNLTKKELFEHSIKQLPADKREAIVQLIHDASMAINSVECELQGTILEQHGLFDGEDHPTLWCQLYDLRKMFSEHLIINTDAK